MDSVNRRQPAGRIAINRGNKFSKRALAFVHVGASNNNTNVVTGKLGTGAGVSRTVTTKGRAITFPNAGGQGLSFGTGTGPLFGTKQTILVISDARAQGVQRNCVFNIRSSIGPFYGAAFNTTDGTLNLQSGTFSMGWQSTSGTNAGGYIPNAITGRVSAYAISRNGASMLGSVDGQTKATTFSGAGGAGDDALGWDRTDLETKVGDLGGFSGTGYGAQHPVLLVLAFNDAFTQAELNELAANPWQILEADPVFPYAALAAASPAVLAAHRMFLNF